MFGGNYYGAPYYGQGPFDTATAYLILRHAFTRAVSGFNRYTRRIF